MAGVWPPGSTAPSCAQLLELPLGEPGSEGRHGAKGGSQGNFQTLRQLLLMGHWTCERDTDHDIQEGSARERQLHILGGPEDDPSYFRHVV